MYFEHQTFNSNILNTKTDSFVQIYLNNENFFLFTLNETCRVG